MISIIQWLIHWLHDASHFAFVATVICGLIAVECASTFCRNSPRVFTVFSFYALDWALLVPYYGDALLKNDPARELFAVFGSFVAVYVGGILKRLRPEHFSSDKVDNIDSWSLSLLLPFLAVEIFPKQTESICTLDLLKLKQYSPIDVHNMDVLASANRLCIEQHGSEPVAITWSSYQHYFSVAMHAFGKDPHTLFDLTKCGMHIFEWWSIFYGMRALYHHEPRWRWILLPAVPYALIDFGYSVYQLGQPLDLAMPQFFLVAFAICKLVYFPVFCWMVLQITSQKFRNMSFWKKCQSLIPLGFLANSIFNKHPLRRV